MKIVYALIAAAFAAGVYAWANAIDHQFGGESWCARLAVASLAVAVVHLIRSMEDK